MGDGDKQPNVPTPFRFRRPWEDDDPTPTTSAAPLQAHLASSLVPIIRPTPLPALPNHSNHQQIIIKSEYEASTDCLSALSKLSNMKTEEFEIKPPLEISKSVQIKVEKEESMDSEEIEVFSFDRQKLQLTSEKVRVKRQSTTSTADSSPIDVENLDENSKCSKKSSASSSMGSGSCSYSLSSSNSECSSSSDSDDRRKKAKRNKIRRNFKKKKLEQRVKREKVKLEEKDDASEEQDENEINDSEAEEEEDEENGSDSDSRIMRLEDFPEGRNKERKNSRWADYGVTRKSNRLRSTKTKFCSKAHKAQVLKRLTSLLKKDPEELCEDDKVNLAAFPELATEARKRLEKRHLASERMKEEEDPADILDVKCASLAQMIAKANYVVLYTGAGISTSALIPDYRGPNGIWTLLRKGQSIADMKQFPQSADPTLTHMAIKELFDNGIVKHIVSQNVDGLHLRSGIPKTALSEVHGNMYIEVCLECHREYVRLFDVTENTKRHHHKTGRSCYHCGAALKDSVVLFGEKGSLRWPINWAGAEYNVDKADVILCLGSSLKVLRRYPWLWSLSKPAKQRPELCIVNLQWTPKDRFATLKINGRCDEVISKVMDKLKISVPEYKRELDPIFSIATHLHPTESSTKRSKDLTLPEGIPYPSKSTDLQNYVKFEPVFCKEVRALNQVKRKVVDGEDEEQIKKDTNANSNKSCGIGWLGNALSVKPKKKKLK